MRVDSERVGSERVGSERSDVEKTDGERRDGEVDSDSASSLFWYIDQSRVVRQMCV